MSLGCHLYKYEHTPTHVHATDIGIRGVYVVCVLVYALVYYQVHSTKKNVP